MKLSFGVWMWLSPKRTNFASTGFKNHWVTFTHEETTYENDLFVMHQYVGPLPRKKFRIFWKETKNAVATGNTLAEMQPLWQIISSHLITSQSNQNKEVVETKLMEWYETQQQKKQKPRVLEMFKRATSQIILDEDNSESDDELDIEDDLQATPNLDSPNEEKKTPQNQHAKSSNNTNNINQNSKKEAMETTSTRQTKAAPSEAISAPNSPSQQQHDMNYFQRQVGTASHLLEEVFSEDATFEQRSIRNVIVISSFVTMYSLMLRWASFDGFLVKKKKITTNVSFFLI